MAGSWLKLECKMLLLGWSSELPSSEYAAWIKLLQVTKAFGERGGRIKYSYFDDCLLGKLNISRHAFDQTISKATANGAVSRDGEYLVLSHWADYQIDPTAAARKAKERATDRTDVTVTSVSHECHDDRTGQDGTGQEKKEEDARAPEVTWTGESFTLTAEARKTLYDRFPNIQHQAIDAEIEDCAAYHVDHRTKMASPRSRITTWLKKAFTGNHGGNGKPRGAEMTEIEVNRMYAKMLDEQPEPVETPEEMADRLEFKRNYPLRRDIG